MNLRNGDARNIIIRANDLFDTLTDNSFDVYVKIDKDGKTELKFKILDNSDSYMQVNVSGTTDKIKTYINGQIELTDDVINEFKQINEIIGQH